MKPEIEDALKWIERLIPYPGSADNVIFYIKIVHAHIVEQDTAIAKLKRKLKLWALFVVLTGTLVIFYTIIVVVIYGILAKP